jgi:hypothetical protein
VLFLGVVAACQPVPQPFAPGVPERANPLLLLPDRAGVVVLELDGAPKAAARDFPAAMVAALLERNIPAWETSGNSASYFLQGEARSEPVAGDRTRITLNWELVDRKGATVGRHALSRITRRRDWRDGSKSTIARLAGASAIGVAALMQDPEPTRSAVLSGRVPVYVAPGAGAPGDGPNALRLAMMAALRRAKLKIVRRNQGKAMEIASRVRIAPARSGRQDVEIVWSVRRPDGVEIGTLKQRNAVPAGSLDKAWGEIAFIIADAAVAGVIDLLGRPAAATETPGGGK